MPFWRRRAARSIELDEFVGEGEDRAATPLDIRPGHGDWQVALAKLSGGAPPKNASELALPAFSLVRGGDLFEAPKRKNVPTSTELLGKYAASHLRVETTRASSASRAAAGDGLLRVLAGNPALCKRMMLARPIRVVVVPPGHDFREYGFPPNTNPRAAGIFWNAVECPVASLALREERVAAKPWLMVHEMTHAVHLMGFTKKERAEIDRMLMPVYRSKRWVEEAVAIYAERAFGAEYDDDDLNAPGLYGKTRRDWNPRHVFSLFVEELFRPNLARAAV